MEGAEEEDAEVPVVVAVRWGIGIKTAFIPTGHLVQITIAMII